MSFRTIAFGASTKAFEEKEYLLTVMRFLRKIQLTELLD